MSVGRRFFVLQNGQCTSLRHSHYNLLQVLLQDTFALLAIRTKLRWNPFFLALSFSARSVISHKFFGDDKFLLFLHM